MSNLDNDRTDRNRADSDKTDSDKTAQHNTDFGQILLTARKAKKLSAEEVAEQLKVPVPIIEAIESSDLEQLPPATFTRGYLRAYARCVEIPDADILSAYARVIPPQSALKAHSRVPNEANSQSPLIKLITVILLVLGLLAVIYGGYQYYSKKSGSLKASLEQEVQQINQETGPMDQLTLKPLPVKPESINPGLVKNQTEFNRVTENVPPQKSAGTVLTTSTTQHNNSAIQQSHPSSVHSVAVKPVISVQGTDSISLLANKGAWLEIKDKTGKRLYYNMIPAGKWMHYTGDAPFDVSMGNARSTRVKVNGVEADVSNYIRSNNTARFQASTIKRDGKITVTLHRKSAD